MAPRVTVLITAFQRQKYLMDAVRSVLASTVGRDLYEVILVIDEIDDRLAAGIAELGVQIIRTPSSRGGEMWVAGLRAASGDVVAFLDDDDCFYPGKLARLLEIFSDPAVVWYHHGFRRVDAMRRPLSPSVPTPSPPRSYPAPLSREDFGRIRHAGGFYNNTCHAVRRSAIVGNLDGFVEVTFGQDFAIPLLTSGPGRVVIDLTNILSEFRTHWSQGSHPLAGNQIPESHLRFLRGIVRTFLSLTQKAPTEDARGFSRCRAESYETLLWTTRGESISDPRGAPARAVRAVYGNLAERDLFHATILSSFLVMAPVSRPFTEAVYMTLKRVEMRSIGLEPPKSSGVVGGIPGDASHVVIGLR